MHWNMADLRPADRYRLIVNTVTPRPIAWTVTLGANGGRNCAPHSFFNALADEPPLVVLGLMAHHERGGDKDTARHIRETGEFVIALVSEADAPKMNVTAADAPPGTDELAVAGIETRPALHVKPPLIASAPVNFECRTWQLLDPSPRSTVVIGEILAIHIDDAFMSADGRRIDTQAMHLLGRQHGAGMYVRNSDSFEMKRLAWPLGGV
jgi:flavin reductase (DIM6/NTAB) family NADH-FMN oxidoreductase RutF